jgi:hypothetical protein
VFSEITGEKRLSNTENGIVSPPLIGHRASFRSPPNVGLNERGRPTAAAFYSDVQVCSPHLHLNMRMLRPLLESRMDLTSLGSSPQLRQAGGSSLSLPLIFSRRKNIATQPCDHDSLSNKLKQKFQKRVLAPFHHYYEWSLLILAVVPFGL